MVCLGNICRSPLAEGILLYKTQQLGLDWEIDSAGTSSYHIGDKPDPRSVEIAGKNGIDITHQNSRQFTSIDFDRFDMIYAMDSSNYQNIKQLARNEADKNKVSLIMNEVQPNRNINVPDPYWGSFGFDRVFEMLSEASEAIIKKYKDIQ